MVLPGQPAGGKMVNTKVEHGSSRRKTWTTNKIKRMDIRNKRVSTHTNQSSWIWPLLLTHPLHSSREHTWARRRSSGPIPWSVLGFEPSSGYKTNHLAPQRMKVGEANIITLREIFKWDFYGSIKKMINWRIFVHKWRRNTVSASVITPPWLQQLPLGPLDCSWAARRDIRL